MKKTKTAIVFGATSGIGKKLTQLLVNDGYVVATTGRRLAKLKELKNQNPNQIIIKQNDITQVNELEKVFNELVVELGEIHLIIHSSGIGDVNTNLGWELENKTVQTNVVGATKLYGLAYNLFKQQQFGHLVGISSIASLRGNRAAPSYFASKAYQKAYLESLYIKTKSIKSKKVFITDIRPGFVKTAMADTLEDGLFWLVPLNKAVQQMYTAIKGKKRVAYVSKRWQLVAWVLRITPAWLLKKTL
ncbi:MAG: SDR family NAD(P)-dependent oxidoreductase, partial [Tenacibaculum sp.]